MNDMTCEAMSRLRYSSRAHQYKEMKNELFKEIGQIIGESMGLKGFMTMDPEDAKSAVKFLNLTKKILDFSDELMEDYDKQNNLLVDLVEQNQEIQNDLSDIKTMLKGNKESK